MSVPHIPTGKPPPERVIDPNTGREILRHASGAEQDAETKRFIRGPNSTPISRDPVGMQRRGQLLRERARVKGIIRGTGLPMPADDDIEGMAQAEASAIEILTALFVNNFMNSDNLRGKAEAFTKLIGSRDKDSDDPAVSEEREIIHMLVEAARRAKASHETIIEADTT